MSTALPAECRLHVLGPVTVRHAADPAASSRVTQPRQLAVLVYLALARPRGLHSRDTLIALLWPDQDETHGRRALRNALHGLRSRLGPGTIVTAGDHLVGLDAALVSCDGVDLERNRAGIVEDPEIEPLSGLHVANAAEFDQWMCLERDRLRELLKRRRPKASGPEAGGLARQRPRPHSLDAAIMYARGHYLFLHSAHGGAPEDLIRSRECYERARALDPAFAPAVSGLANFYAVAARRGLLEPFHETFAEAIALSERALAMDPWLAVPHVHFGVEALYLDGDWDRAGREFATAVEKDADYAEGHRFYGVWLGLVGRHDEALAEMHLADELEPGVPHILSSLGAARVAVGDLVGAEAALRRTLEIDTRHGPARERLLRILEDAGRFDEAVAERRREPPTADAPTFHHALAHQGPDGYRDALSATLRAQAEALEEKVIPPRRTTASEIFSPSVVRLVGLWMRLGEVRRARTWRLQAISADPTLRPWLDATVDAHATRGQALTPERAGPAQAR